MVVQGGRVSSPQIRDLKDVVERKKAAMGLFISLEESTQDMRDEEASGGVYPSDLWQQDFPKIQIRIMGEFTFQVQHLVVKGLGRRAVAEALAGGIVVQLDDLRKGRFGEVNQPGLAGERAPQAADGVLHAPFLPGGAGIAEESLDTPGHGGGSGGRTRCHCRR